jgi:hypothetical protein
MKLAPRVWVPIAVVAGVIFYGALYLSGAHGEGFKFLDQAIRTAPSIRDRVGDVQTVSPSFLHGFRDRTVGEDEWLKMTLDVTGQKGSGTVVANAKKINGVWSVTDASMDGSPIRLQ